MYKNVKKLYRLYESAYESAYGNNNQMRFTVPKIYTGGNDLKKRWYVYYSIEDPQTGKLVRQSYISMGVNRYRTLTERLSHIKILQRAIHDTLKAGHSPYPALIEPEEEVIEIITANTAILEVLELKQKVVKETTYSDYRIRTTQFLEFLKKNNLLHVDVLKIDRRIVNKYLDKILLKSGARNRNNTKTVLSAIFSSMESKGYIPVNFIKSMETLKTNSKRDKTITSEDLAMILEHLEKEDPLLLFYVEFISFFFFRPVEVNRLKVGSVNLKDRLISVETKQKASKTKIIPELVLDKLTAYLANATDKEHYLFTPEGAGDWDAQETNRRDHFSKRFSKVKRKLNLPAGYSLYSFRHTFITKVYKQLRKDFTIDEAIAKLKLITGHESEAIQRYIHMIDAELPEDYSDMLK